MAQLLTSTPNI